NGLHTGAGISKATQNALHPPQHRTDATWLFLQRENSGRIVGASQCFIYSGTDVWRTRCVWRASLSPLGSLAQTA
ncbi:hypothetical protein, partial [Xanthomonas campestris]|uniref:hypothetical protein n=1 Tax=Xanthomonas campestris TaxID=339 RepID=UPI002B23A702